MNIKTRKKGFILVATMMVALLVGVLLIGLSNVQALDWRLMNNHTQSLKAYYIAEAGIAEAIDTIRQNGPDNLDTHSWSSEFPPDSDNGYTVMISDCNICSAGTVTTTGFSRALKASVSVSGTSSPYTVKIIQWQEIDYEQILSFSEGQDEDDPDDADEPDEPDDPGGGWWSLWHWWHW